MAAQDVRISHRMGEPLPGTLRVGRGAEIVVTLTGTAAYEWTPVESLNPAVAAVRPATAEPVPDSAEPVTTAIADAAAAGQAELRSTASFRGDRFGPRTLLWRLIVVVEDP